MSHIPFTLLRQNIDGFCSRNINWYASTTTLDISGDLSARLHRQELVNMIREFVDLPLDIIIDPFEHLYIVPQRLWFIETKKQISMLRLFNKSRLEEYALFHNPNVYDIFEKHVTNFFLAQNTSTLKRLLEVCNPYWQLLCATITWIHKDMELCVIVDYNPSVEKNSS